MIKDIITHAEPAKISLKVKRPEDKVEVIETEVNSLFDISGEVSGIIAVVRNSK